MVSPYVSYTLVWTIISISLKSRVFYHTSTIIPSPCHKGLFITLNKMVC